jgi:hypothetical protein
MFCEPYHLISYYNYNSYKYLINDIIKLKFILTLNVTQIILFINKPITIPHLLQIVKYITRSL